eukprot:350388-Chlamydomonas_euryale.AAC.21
MPNKGSGQPGQDDRVVEFYDLHPTERALVSPCDAHVLVKIEVFNKTAVALCALPLQHHTPQCGCRSQPRTSPQPSPPERLRAPARCSEGRRSLHQSPGKTLPASCPTSAVHWHSLIVATTQVASSLATVATSPELGLGCREP